MYMLKKKKLALFYRKVARYICIVVCTDEIYTLTRGPRKPDREIN